MFSRVKKWWYGYDKESTRETYSLLCSRMSDLKKSSGASPEVIQLEQALRFQVKTVEVYLETALVFLCDPEHSGLKRSIARTLALACAGLTDKSRGVDAIKSKIVELISEQEQGADGVKRTLLSDVDEYAEKMNRVQEQCAAFGLFAREKFDPQRTDIGRTMLALRALEEKQEPNVERSYKETRAEQSYLNYPPWDTEEHRINAANKLFELLEPAITAIEDAFTCLQAIRFDKS